MKRFALSGQILGPILITLGLIFNRCAGPDGDNGSSEAAAPADAQGSYGVIPISVNGENGELTIGSQADGLSELTTVSGHSVEIVNGSTSIVGGKGTCSGSMGDIKCWIKLINRDPSYGMYNVSFNANPWRGCWNCGTAVFNNADNVQGNTIHDIGEANKDVPILGAGYCYAEDGNFGAKKPFNARGCSTYYTPGTNPKPIQVLHPQCGQRSELLDFGNPADPTARYTFFASISADFLPWSPLGADGIRGTGDDDARYDFQNYTTVYIILADMANARPGRYIFGSWKRSNAIAGYGAPGNVSGANLSPGTYFGVNVAVEAPDRVENYYMADVWHLSSNPHGYEFYIMSAVFFRYNPFVIERVRLFSHAGKTYIKNQARDMCFVHPNSPCGNIHFYQSYSHLEPVNDGSNSFYGFGWVALYRNVDIHVFGYYDNATAATTTYHTDGGGHIMIMPGAKVCTECGQKGFAKINRAFLGATINSTNTSAGKPAFTRDGPDAEPEQTVMVYHFYVKNNTIGKGSEIRTDTYSTFTQFQFELHPYPEKTTLVPGGFNLDWADYCYPFNTTPPQSHYCPTPLNWNSDIIVFQSKERMNPNIHQSGESVSGPSGTFGGIQAWNTYVCVQ
jgi:hypothetical protein